MAGKFSEMHADWNGPNIFGKRQQEGMPLKIRFFQISKIGQEEVICYLSASNWKYGSNYWTSGLRVTQKSFSWCSKSGSTPIIEAEQSWASEQPDNINSSQNCIHMNVIRENATVLLSDRKCTDYYVFSCQVYYLTQKNSCLESHIMKFATRIKAVLFDFFSNL
jgi:hypothetical protein